MCFFIVPRSAFGVCKPVHSVVFMKVFWMSGDEFHGFRPEGRDGFRAVVDVDDEAVGLVVVFHVAEYIVVDVAEEARADLRQRIFGDLETVYRMRELLESLLDIGFYPPVVPYVL